GLAGRGSAEPTAMACASDRGCLVWSEASVPVRLSRPHAKAAKRCATERSSATAMPTKPSSAGCTAKSKDTGCRASWWAATRPPARAHRLAEAHRDCAKGLEILRQTSGADSAFYKTNVDLCRGLW